MKWNSTNLTSSSSKYLKVRQGKNKIRIVSEVGVYGTHWKEGKTTVCIGKDKGCYLCAEKSEVKGRWTCWVIDRTDGKIKQFDMGYTIIQQIQKLAQSDDYSFETIPSYDMEITKTGEGLETEYTVIPARQDTPLTDEEKEQIEGLASVDELIEKKKIAEPF